MQRRFDEKNRKLEEMKGELVDIREQAESKILERREEPSGAYHSCEEEISLGRCTQEPASPCASCHSSTQTVLPRSPSTSHGKQLLANASGETLQGYIHSPASEQRNSPRRWGAHGLFQITPPSRSISVGERIGERVGIDDFVCADQHSSAARAPHTRKPVAGLGVGHSLPGAADLQARIDSSITAERQAPFLSEAVQRSQRPQGQTSAFCMQIGSLKAPGGSSDASMRPAPTGSLRAPVGDGSSTGGGAQRSLIEWMNVCRGARTPEPCAAPSVLVPDQSAGAVLTPRQVLKSNHDGLSSPQGQCRAARNQVATCGTSLRLVPQWQPTSPRRDLSPRLAPRSPRQGWSVSSPAAAAMHLPVAHEPLASPFGAGAQPSRAASLQAPVAPQIPSARDRGGAERSVSPQGRAVPPAIAMHLPVSHEPLAATFGAGGQPTRAAPLQVPVVSQTLSAGDRGVAEGSVSQQGPPVVTSPRRDLSPRLAPRSPRQGWSASLPPVTAMHLPTPREPLAAPMCTGGQAMAAVSLQVPSSPRIHSTRGQGGVERSVPSGGDERSISQPRRAVPHDGAVRSVSPHVRAVPRQDPCGAVPGPTLHYGLDSGPALWPWSQ